ncbi:LysR family transcriptional regulator [Rhodobium gokarnense]|uniref:DNA-binding transcriptional LysR family regulator n=1 Tax=Rhodobium gokarnense TaxID=364296 RepID=A0ABT3HEZ1_9HYPH|nr:LysR family transcriptional regulator [Rhodobium gokarnense]MCW2308909.1 DNA-binding transcriptional LysR family regulator [Rhodobium gokarnense]
MANNSPFPPMDDLAVFLAVRRAGGFRVAARWLHLSPSTVSETVSRLEAGLGVPLFTRTTRSVQLTEAGRALAERIEPVMSEARAALDEAASSKGQVRGRIKLNVPGAVMVDILPPLLDGFLARHPDVQAEIMVDDRLVDITAVGCDAGIRYDEHLAQDMIAVPIGPRTQWAALAAAPGYLERRGTPRHPRDLMDHDCIRARFASGALSEWEFERDGEVLIVDPPARIVMASGGAAAMIDLAIAGHGMVHTFRNWLEPHMQSGALVPVLADWWQEFDGPKLYFSSRFMPTVLRAFIDFIAEKRGQA